MTSIHTKSPARFQRDCLSLRICDDNSYGKFCPRLTFIGLLSFECVGVGADQVILGGPSVVQRECIIRGKAFVFFATLSYKCQLMLEHFSLVFYWFENLWCQNKYGEDEAHLDEVIAKLNLIISQENLTGLSHQRTHPEHPSALALRELFSKILICKWINLFIQAQTFISQCLSTVVILIGQFQGYLSMF